MSSARSMSAAIASRSRRVVAPSAIFSATVNDPKMCRPSGTRATPRAASNSGAMPRIGVSASRTSPCLARTTPAMASSRVDLPAPFGPMTATISPSDTSSDTPRRATMLP